MLLHPGVYLLTTLVNLGNSCWSLSIASLTASALGRRSDHRFPRARQFGHHPFGRREPPAARSLLLLPELGPCVPHLLNGRTRTAGTTPAMVVMATAASRAIPAVRIREHVGCRKKNAGCSPFPSAGQRASQRRSKRPLSSQEAEPGGCNEWSLGCPTRSAACQARSTGVSSPQAPQPSRRERAFVTPQRTSTAASSALSPGFRRRKAMSNK
jgi:hypothetical protein